MVACLLCVVQVVSLFTGYRQLHAPVYVLLATLLTLSLRRYSLLIGDRAFSAAATSVWNSLPEAVRSSASLVLFRKSLKTALFARSYTD